MRHRQKGESRRNQRLPVPDGHRDRRRLYLGAAGTETRRANTVAADDQLRRDQVVGPGGESGGYGLSSVQGSARRMARILKLSPG